MEELQIVEYNNVRVVTTKQLAEVYGTDSKTISKNFNRNKIRFVEKKHYICLTGDELKSFKNKSLNFGFVDGTGRQFDDQSKIKNQNIISSRAKNLYLWTERGALLLAKSINTDVAWDAYERLVDFYFQKKQEHKNDIPFVKDSEKNRIPLVNDWFERNKWRIFRICERTKVDREELYYHMLIRISEKYDLVAAKELYKDDVGHYPIHDIDMVRFYPELEKEADYYLDRVERQFWC